MSFHVKIYDDDMPAGYAQAVTLLQAASAFRELLYNVPEEIIYTVPVFIASLRTLENDFYNEANRIINEEDNRFDELKLKRYREAHNGIHVA